MLTIFDYLRRRAFESIISGVQDAVESLNHPAQSANTTQASGAGTQPESKPAILPAAAAEPAQLPLFNPDRYLAGPSPGAPLPENLPPRRRPGRPRNDSKAQ